MGSRKWGKMEEGRENGRWNGREVQTTVKPKNVGKKCYQLLFDVFWNYLNFVTIFCRVLKKKINFLNIPSYPPPFAVQNSLTNQFYQKENYDFLILKKT